MPALAASFSKCSSQLWIGCESLRDAFFDSIQRRSLRRLGNHSDLHGRLGGRSMLAKAGCENIVEARCNAGCQLIGINALSGELGPNVFVRRGFEVFECQRSNCGERFLRFVGHRCLRPGINLSTCLLSLRRAVS